MPLTESGSKIFAVERVVDLDADLEPVEDQPNSQDKQQQKDEDDSATSPNKKPRKKRVERTNEFWYNLIKLKEHHPDGAVREMTVTKFLKSDLSGPEVSGSASEQQQFTRRLRLFRQGKLPGANEDASAKYSESKRNRKGKFSNVEYKLQMFLKLKAELHKQERCGLSWNEIQQKVQHYIDLERVTAMENGDNRTAREYKNFKVSPGWITNFLRRNGCTKQLKHELETKLLDLERKSFDNLDMDESPLPQTPPPQNCSPTAASRFEIKQVDHAKECIANLKDFCHNYCYDVLKSEDLHLLEIFQVKLSRSQGKKHKRKKPGMRKKKEVDEMSPPPKRARTEETETSQLPPQDQYDHDDDLDEDDQNNDHFQEKEGIEDDASDYHSSEENFIHDASV